MSIYFSSKSGGPCWSRTRGYHNPAPLPRFVKQMKAVEYGAVEITWKQSGCMCSIAKTGLPMGDPATAEARFLEMYEARKAARSL